MRFSSISDDRKLNACSVTVQVREDAEDGFASFAEFFPEARAEGRRGDGRVQRPAFGAGGAAAVKIVLVVKLPLPLFLRHDCVVVTVVVQELLALSDGTDGPHG